MKQAAVIGGIKRNVIGIVGLRRAGCICLALLPVCLISVPQRLSAVEPPGDPPQSHLLAAAQPASVPPPNAERVRRLVESLGDADYFVRERAGAELRKLGFDAVDALTAATENDDLEVVARANRLLNLIRANWSLPGEPPAVARLLRDYDSQDDSNREARVLRLIDLPQHQGAAAICRVIHYERSYLLAKTAALRLLQSLTGESVSPDLAATLQKGLGNCQRAPAQWVLAWLQARNDPSALVRLWTRLAAEEEDLLFRQPRNSSLAIVDSLLRFEIAGMRKVGRGAETATCIQRLIQLRRGEPDELARLLQWLIDQKDWAATRLVENRCQTTIAESSDLLYLVADAQMQRGDAAAGEQSADRALKLDPKNDLPSLGLHLQAGERLERADHPDWAAKEWEYVIRSAPPRSALGVIAARLLAESHHDHEEDGPAAETLRGVEKEFAGRSHQWQILDNDPESTEPLTLGMLRARMNYFEACYWKSQGDRARQRQCLDRALASDGYDIEVLIECYQMPDSPPDYRARIHKLIAKRLCDLRELAADFGENSAAAQPCNEFAWLTANTQGNLDEALRLSKRSIDLVGEYGAYRDTLARVYFAKGDYASAVMQQTRAAELLPHVHAVQKQLALFRKKAAEKGIKLDKIPKLEKPASPAEKAADHDPFG